MGGVTRRPNSVVSRRTISAAKWLRMKHLRQRRFVPSASSTFRIPPTSTMATMITDSGFPQVCRVGRTNNLIHHGRGARPRAGFDGCVRCSNFDPPSPIHLPNDRYNMIGDEPRPNDRAALHRGNRRFATMQNGATMRTRSAAELVAIARLSSGATTARAQQKRAGVFRPVRIRKELCCFSPRPDYTGMWNRCVLARLAA